MNKAQLHSHFKNLEYPLANAMWDFSWIERRYTGGGYENWNSILDELKIRGYDAVRIDAYPHLVSKDPGEEWLLLPEWSVHDWGSPGNIKVQIQPNLNIFIEKCAERNIKIMLSTWWRKNKNNNIKNINTPKNLAEAWESTLDTINEAGLLENIFYVDICNEYPHPDWSKFLPEDYDNHYCHNDYKPWMEKSTKILKSKYPSIPFTFSFFGNEWLQVNETLPYLDFLEIHVWMANFSNFEKDLDYHWEPHNNLEYNKIQKAEKLYREEEKYWKKRLLKGINFCRQISENIELPLITTEAWGPITYKDWPMLDWEWVKEICAYGVRKACQTKRWASMCTSNFSGPQFKGMWQDIEWHRELTDMIHTSEVNL